MFCARPPGTNPYKLEMFKLFYFVLFMLMKMALNILSIPFTVNAFIL